jgi:GTP-binding protein
VELNAKFVTSARSLSGCPRWDLLEIAVAGRSNVGKSSLINALTGIKGLARTSKTPGRTQSINFFQVEPRVESRGDRRFALVDLPGFGYARMPKTEAEIIGAMMRDYLTNRKNFSVLLLLVDTRRGPADEEFGLARSITNSGRGLIVVGTKSDKLRSSERSAAASALQKLAGGTESHVILSSALKRENIDKLQRLLVESARNFGKRHAAFVNSNET